MGTAQSLGPPLAPDTLLHSLISQLYDLFLMHTAAAFLVLELFGPCSLEVVEDACQAMTIQAWMGAVGPVCVLVDQVQQGGVQLAEVLCTDGGGVWLQGQKGLAESVITPFKKPAGNKKQV